MKMVTESLVETIKRELPGLLREDPGLRNHLVDLTRDLYAYRDETPAALGSRWGLQSEAAFRNALAGILEEGFGSPAVCKGSDFKIREPADTDSVRVQLGCGTVAEADESRSGP